MAAGSTRVWPAFAWAALHETVGLAAPAATGYAIHAVAVGDREAFARSLLVVLVAPFVESAFLYRAERVRGKMAEMGGIAERERLLSHLLLLPLVWFAPSGTRRLVGTLGGDIEWLTDWRRTTVDAFRGVVAVAAIVPILAFQDWRLATVCLAASGLVAFHLFRETSQSLPASVALAECEAAFRDYVATRVRSSSLTHAMGAIRWELGRSKLVTQAFRSTLTLKCRHDTRLELGAGLVHGAQMTAIFAFGLTVLRGNQAALPGLVMAIAYSGRLSAAFQHWLAFGRLRGSASVRKARLSAFYATPVERWPGRGLPPCRVDSIVMSGVSFSYTESGHGIHDVCLELSRGEVVALTGPSGGGKTTIADAVGGLLAPSNGDVFIGPEALPLSSLNLAAWRSRVAYADQRLHSLLLDDDGMWLRTPDAECLLAMVGLSGMVDAEASHSLAQVGSRLSVGEVQRLAVVSSALMEDPVLYVFDEPTASQDTANESLLASLIRRCAAKAPVLLISHRVDTLLTADRVAIVIDGTVHRIFGSMELRESPGLLEEWLASWADQHLEGDGHESSPAELCE